MLRPMKKMCARNIKLQESVGAKFTIMPGDLGIIFDRRSLAQKKTGPLGPCLKQVFYIFHANSWVCISNLCSRFFYRCNQLLAHIFWLAIRISKRGLADHDIYPIFSRGNCWGLFHPPIKNSEYDLYKYWPEYNTCTEMHCQMLDWDHFYSVSIIVI